MTAFKACEFGMFDNPWRDRNERALAALAPLEWAQPLLKRVRSLGIALKHDDTLFELRYAHDLARADVSPVYEHPTGVGNYKVDFKLPGKVPWLVELVSIRESEAMTAATIEETLGNGIRTQTLLLTSTAGLADPSKKKQTQQEELLRVVYKLGEKVFDGTKPVKFPAPDGSAFHMLLVDIRGLEGIGGHADRDHCRQIVFGPDRVSDKAFVAAHADTGEPIRGVWDEANTSRAAHLLRERIHVIGFVHEHLFCDDEIRDVMVAFMNPAFPSPSDRFHDLYPLNTRDRLDFPARVDNPLWNWDHARGKGQP